MFTRPITEAPLMGGVTLHSNSWHLRYELYSFIKYQTIILNEDEHIVTNFYCACALIKLNGQLVLPRP